MLESAASAKGTGAALKWGQDCQGVLQAEKNGNIHLGMAQPAEELAPSPHLSKGKKQKSISQIRPHQAGVLMVAEQQNSNNSIYFIHC